MAIFVIFRVKNSTEMEKAIKAKLPDNHLKMDTGEWVVSFDGNAQTLSDNLGITGDKDNALSAVIFSMDNYYGRAPTNIWDWIKNKLEKAA